MDSSEHEILREGRFSRSFKTGQEVTRTVSEKIAAHQDQLERLLRRAREGYVKPLSLELNDVDPAIDLILVPLVSLADSSAPWMIAGLFIDTHRFVQDVVIRKFNEMDDGNLAFATRSQEGDILFISDQETDPVFEKSDALWILPDLQLLVKMKGTTLQSLSRQRTRNHLIFLLVINLLLGAGIITFIQSVNKAIRLARMQSDFVANVSHELRTPLALIRMYAETLELGRITSKSKQKKYYRTIMNECSRLTQLVNNILDFSKIESHKKEYAFQAIQPEYWLAETLKSYRFHLDQKGFQLDADIEGEFPKIRADREAITQALTNLLDNAVKFSGDSRKIDVSLEKTDSSVSLAVTDYGIGIASSEQKLIFDKFYRVGSSLIHDVKGTGLGLSLVKHIMQVHGGRVEVKSEPGHGSTFTLIFPIDGT